MSFKKVQLSYDISELARDYRTIEGSWNRIKKCGITNTAGYFISKMIFILSSSYHEKIFPIEGAKCTNGTKKLSSLKNTVSQSENKESYL
jgi:hypothetical protein